MNPHLHDGTQVRYVNVIVVLAEEPVAAGEQFRQIHFGLRIVLAAWPISLRRRLQELFVQRAAHKPGDAISSAEVRCEGTPSKLPSSVMAACKFPGGRAPDQIRFRG